MNSLSSKTIGIVANSSWNIFNFRTNLIEKLVVQGAKVIVFSPVDEYITYKKRFPSVRHIPIKHLSRDGKSVIQDIFLLWELVRLYKKNRSDLIIHYTVKPNIYGAIAAYICRIMSIGVVTGLGYPFLHRGRIQNIVRFLYRITSRFHQKMIFENTEDLEFFVKCHLLDPAKGVAVKGCGVDIHHFSPQPDGMFPGKTIFTFIGRLLYDKGLREFVDAARRVKSKYANSEFWVVGEIDRNNPSSIKEEDLVTWVREEFIQYYGSVKDTRPVIAHSDCIVLPSYREAIPRSLTEAMSMERPVICSDVAGCRETVDHGINGFLVPVADAVALSRAMEEFIMLDSSSREKLGIAGRIKVVDHFDDRKVADELQAIILSAMDIETSHA